MPKPLSIFENLEVRKFSFVTKNKEGYIVEVEDGITGEVTKFGNPLPNLDAALSAAVKAIGLL